METQWIAENSVKKKEKHHHKSQYCLANTQLKYVRHCSNGRTETEDYQTTSMESLWSEGVADFTRTNM